MSELEDLPYYFFALGLGLDELGSCALVYLAKSLLNKDTINYVPVIDGVMNHSLIRYKSYNKIITSDDVITTMQRIIQIIRVSTSGMDEISFIVSLIALIHLAAKYTKDPVGYLKENGWLSKQGQQYIERAYNIYRTIKIRLGVLR